MVASALISGHIKLLILQLFLKFVFSASNSVDNPTTLRDLRAHRELRLVWVAVQVIILEIILVIAGNYVLDYYYLRDQLSGYSSGNA
ncbi:MAG: hypothetical protein EZS28_029030 [Streblomastix strix]|uniref:Uncharacterized protein n=1 Tax=Streblomastix strix TaxID=222440 RepID=A0A5J4UZ13_9EUKA|nr:MAG: hypothetical protein EZS28_029030 [Streblomastix strix]